MSKINDIELTMTFELYFDLMWEETRFVINETSEKWGQVIKYILALIFLLHLFMMLKAKVKQICSEQKHMLLSVT